MRLLCASVTLAFAATSLAQLPASSSKSQQSAPAPCTVGGRVVSASDGAPIKGARVVLLPDHRESENHNFGAISDNDGRFNINGVPPGRYEFLASRAGYVTEQYQSQESEGGALLALKRGQTISDILFRLALAGVITGRLTNEDSEPMIDVQVVALRKPTEEDADEEDSFAARQPRPIPVASAQTDDRGQYRLFGLEPGEYFIRAADSFDPGRGLQVGKDYWAREALGTQYAPMYFPGVMQLDGAQTVSVTAGQEIQADFSMRRVTTVEVSGRAIGPGGPAKQVWVSLSPSEAPGYGYDPGHQTTTDEKGNFKIKGVPPGSYVLTAYQSNEENGVYEATARLTIEVGNDNIESLTLVLGAGATLEGRITLPAVYAAEKRHVVVDLLPTTGEEYFGRGSREKKDGTFEITLVKDGDYALGVWGLQHDCYVKAARFGSDDVLEKGLRIEKGSSGGKLEIVVASDGAQIDGAIRDGEQAMIGARVRITPEPETAYNRFRSRSTRTDQTGRFSVTGLAPGKYRLSARSVVPGQSVAVKSDSQTITLSEHDHKTLQLFMVTP
jgi:Carboxypeptidase regulatory-like domain